MTRALNLTCPALPDAPWISATVDGAVVMAITSNEDRSEALARLMTVGAAESRVEDVPALADPRSALPSFSILNSAMGTDSTGAKWLFAGSAPSITLVRETRAGWTRSTVVAAPNPSEWAYLTDVSLVDESLGYLTYASEWSGYAPHLVTWDGSCWTDQTVGVTPTHAMVVETDAEKGPWVAWLASTNSLYLRSPDGDIRDLLANISPDALAGVTVPLRLLPGGLDGTAPFPAVAARAVDGIQLLLPGSTLDSDWHSVVLPMAPAHGTGDCPAANPSRDVGDPCSGQTSCHAQLSAPSSGFDLVRVRSGATFAAWVVYSSDGSYRLNPVCDAGEMPTCWCDWTETSGTGTADLVVARLTESEPTLSHFLFDMGGATLNVSYDVKLASRGDTLLVAAYLGGSKIRALTYVEIDSTLLP